MPVDCRSLLLQCPHKVLELQFGGPISARGTSGLKIFLGMDSMAYVNCIKECLLEDAEVLYPDGWILMHNNASKKTTEWILKDGSVINWPSL